MGKRNYNRGGRRSQSGANRRSRRSRNLLSAKLNPQGAPGKNARRREISQKTRAEAQGKILGVLDKLATKLDDMLKLFVKEDKREKEKEQEKKHKSLGRKIWDSMTKEEMLQHATALGLGGLAAFGFINAVAGGEDVPAPEQTGSDESPPPLPEGVQVINGAKLYIGPNVNLDGMNQDFLRRFTEAVKEYQEVYKGGVVRIGSGYRTLAQQKALYDKDVAEHGGYATKTAPPGRSMHEYGFALDTNTKEADAMEALKLFEKYGLVRSEKKISQKTGKLIETWHVEDAKMQGLKGKLKEAGADSTFAIRMRKGLNPETGLPDESSVAIFALAEDIVRRAQVAQTMDQLNILQQALPGANVQSAENIETVKAAQGAMVNVIAGEAGPELILPMNQRGGEILAGSISAAFKEIATSRTRKSSVDKFKTFFEGRFLPELRKQLGKN